MKIRIWLSIIFCVALFLRLYDLGEMPSGFHRDEVISGYAGRFILENGKDFYGNPWPLIYVDKYNDYPPALPMYLSGFGTYLFGMTVFATRFPIAIIGALIIFPLFFLAREIFKDQRIALLSAGLIAVLPWHLVISRTTAEGIVALTVATTGMYALFSFINTKQLRFLSIAVALFFLTYFLYPSYRILVPLLLLPLPFLFTFSRRTKLFIVASIVFFVAIIGLIGTTDWGQGRFTQTTMLSSQNLELTQARNSILAAEEGTGEVTLVKIFHNKYVLLSRQFTENYFSYFSPHFLLFPGGQPSRYVVSDSGILFFFMLPFLFLALYYFKDLKIRLVLFLVYLVLVSPMPSPVTIDEIPNVHRSLFMVIPLTILASFGFIKLIDKIKAKRIRYGVIVGVVGVFLLEFIFFQHMYYSHANSFKSNARGDTNKEAMISLVAQRDNFKKIYAPMDDALPIYYLFYSKNFDPSVIGKIHPLLVVDSIDNIVFTKETCYLKQLNTASIEQNVLYVEREECPIDKRFKKTQEFIRHGGTTSYRFFVANESTLNNPAKDLQVR